MNPLKLVRLDLLMALTSGRPEIRVAVIDGPVLRDHPSLSGKRIRIIGSGSTRDCDIATSVACRHGTFVAGLLIGGATVGGSSGICPDCTLLSRPIFPERNVGFRPSAHVEHLATAVIECVDGGARVLNLSLAPSEGSGLTQTVLQRALDYAAQRGVIVVAAAGNQGCVGSSTITRHPMTIPVVAYDARGYPMPLSNLSRSIGRRGIGAPGDLITGISAGGGTFVAAGTSAAAPFVTGTIALLCAQYPDAPAGEICAAVRGFDVPRRKVVPPLLDAWAAYERLSTLMKGGSNGRSAI